MVTMRRIFVGSSTEALEKARDICRVLSSVEETKPVLFKEFFEPGFLTFEALEEMLLQCCAAVFVATPDDSAVIRGRNTRCPRANVLLEFGLVAGRLGRHNVAVCQYGGAELPSDLKGLTVIEIDSTEPGLESPGITRAYEKLRIWASRLVSTTETIERTNIVHGYSGKWDFKVRLDKWRDFPIEYPNYAQMNGAFNLFIPASGNYGSGLAHGRLFFKLEGQSSSDTGPFQGELRSAHEITNAVCHKDGRVEFTSQIFITQMITTTGEAPPQLVGLDVLPEPWTSQWILCPSSEPRTLVGVVSTEGCGVSQGTVKATKSDSLQ
jgi:hypothetical protein